MIAVGSIVSTSTGRYRLAGFQPDGRLNLQDLGNRLAFVLRDPQRIADLEIEIEAEPTDLEVIHVSRSAPTAAAPPTPTTRAAGVEHLSPVPVGYVMPPALETLGAVQPGRTLCTAPNNEVFYWRPCIARSEIEPGEPHAHFIASNLIINMYCPACRPNRIRIVDAFQVPKVLPPWGAGDAIWDLTGGAKGEKLREWYEERAAVMEYEGGLPRPAAQDQAYSLLLARIRGALFA